MNFFLSMAEKFLSEFIFNDAKIKGKTKNLKQAADEIGFLVNQKKSIFF